MLNVLASHQMHGEKDTIFGRDPHYVFHNAGRKYLGYGAEQGNRLVCFR